MLPRCAAESVRPQSSPVRLCDDDHCGFFNCLADVTNFAPFQDVTLDIDEVGATMYDLELAQDPQFARPVQPNVQVPLADTVYVRATLFMGE